MERDTMNIIRLYVDGFKNVDQVNLRIDKMTALLSPNNYGKSNVLRALDFGFRFMTAGQSEKSKMMGYKNAFPMNQNHEKSHFTFEIELENSHEGKHYHMTYSYSFQWRMTAKSKSGVTHEHMAIRNTAESRKPSAFITRHDAKAFYKPSPTSRCDKSVLIDSDQLVLNKLEALDDLFYLHYAIKPLNKATFYLDRHFDSVLSYEMSPIVMKGNDDLSLDSDSEIPRVLFRLKQDHPDKFELITNTIINMFPFIQSIEIRELVLGQDKIPGKLSDDAPFVFADRIYALYATHKNIRVPINFSQLSDGVRRVLLLLTHIVLAEINQVVLIGIEEPENSINPGLLKKYIIALDNFTDTCKIIITSHSPFLVNYIDPHDLYLGVPAEDGIARFKRIEKASVKKLYNEADDLDMSFGEYLFDLLSGSEDDYKTLGRYFQK
jgi:predicted ATPase